MIRGSRTTIKGRGWILRVHVTLKNELVVADAMTTKFSCKQWVPTREISGKDELGPEPKNDREFGTDGKNDAVTRESCKSVPAYFGALDLIQGAIPATKTKAKNLTPNQFWYYQPITYNEPKLVKMMERDEQLGKPA